jgi:general secretion pathway protein B
MLSELPFEFRRSLPGLEINASVYNADPAQRFALINMHRYQEGEKLTEGPVLEEIRRNSLVLSYGGQRFRLPRL